MSEGTQGWLPAPTWLVDAPRLRETLEALRSALEAAAPVGRSINAAALVYDHGAVADSLRHILERLDAVDLDATRALSDVPREYRTEAQATRLRGLFVALDEALRHRLSAILGAARIRAIARLLASPTPDVLRILGREDHENSHSDLIAWLLTPRRAPVVALHALRQLTSRFPDAARWSAAIADAVADDTLSVRRECVMARELTGDDDLDRIDILISGPGFVLAIENKVWAREHGDQTAAYWSWLERCAGLRGGLFMSPSGATCSCAEFVSIS
jgi:hypothetical protein